MLHLMKLENRIVLDAAAIGDAVSHLSEMGEAGDPGEVHKHVPVFNDPDAQAERSADVAAAAALLSDRAPTDPTYAASEDMHSVDIVVMPDNLSNNPAEMATLKAAVNPGVIVIEYDGDADSPEDVIQKISEKAGERNIGSLTVLSHGGAGFFTLGNEMVEAGNLKDIGNLDDLGRLMAPDGQILLYGCSVVASGDNGFGQDLLDGLAGATGATVFASTDLTGKGGDWDLEAASRDSRYMDADAEGVRLSLDLAVLAEFGGRLTTSVPSAITTLEDEPGSFGIFIYGPLENAGSRVASDVELTDFGPDSLFNNADLFYNGYITDRPREIDGVMVDEYHRWTVDYDPVQHENGTGEINFSISRNGVFEANFDTTVTILPVNDPPVAEDDEITTNEDTPITANLIGNDPVEGDSVTFEILTQPQNGTVVLLDPNTGQYTYTPNQDYSGQDSFTFRVDDGQSENNLSEPATVDITVIPTNDPPRFPQGTEFELNPIDEDPLESQNLGDLISELIDGTGDDTVTDPDGPDEPEGIAIIGQNTLNGGTWQYNIGSGWVDVDAGVSESSAILLADNARLRFTPDDNWNSGDPASPNKPSLTIRAWDQSDGRASGTTGVDVASEKDDPTSAFSQETGQATIVVNAINDAPILDQSPAGVTVGTVEEDEDGNNDGTPGFQNTVQQVIQTLNNQDNRGDITPIGDAITDVDAEPFNPPSAFPGEGLVVVGVDNGALLTLGDGTVVGGTNRWEYQVPGSNQWVSLSGVSPSQAVVLDANTQVRFVPDSNWNGEATLTVRAWDLTDGADSGTVVDANRSDVSTAPRDVSPFSAATDILRVRITPDGDPPDIDPDPDNPDQPDPDDPGKKAPDFENTFIEAQDEEPIMPVNVVDADAVITDPDSADLVSMTVRIANLQEGDILRFGAGQTSGLFAGTNITGNYDAANGTLSFTGTDTIGSYQALLRTITFENTSDTPVPLSDPNSVRTLEFRTVDDTVDEQGNPAGLPSLIAQSEITVVPRNDSPIIDLDSTDGLQRQDLQTNIVVEYQIGEGPVSLTNEGRIIDVDDDFMTQMVVNITNENGQPYDPNGINQGDVLLFNTDGTNITGSYDAATGRLTLTGQSEVKTTFDGQVILGDSRESFEQVLNTIQYNNTSERLMGEQLETRIISFQAVDAGDDTGTSANPLDPFQIMTGQAALAVVTFGNVRPTVDLDPNDDGGDDDPTPPGPGEPGLPNKPGLRPDFNVIYIEKHQTPDGLVACAPVPIADADAIITDPDSPELNALTVTLTNRFAGDQLAFNQGIVDANGLAVNVVEDGATLQLQFTGVASLESYSQLLRSITFQTTGDAPEDAQRIIDVTATDTDGNISDVVNSFVTVVPVNDAPEINGPDELFTTINTDVDLDTISVDDPDAGDGMVFVRLQVDNGVIAVAPSANVEGNGTDTIEIRGLNRDGVNALLQTLTYTPPQGFAGLDNLTVFVSDQGNEGVNPERHVIDCNTLNVENLLNDTDNDGDLLDPNNRIEIPGFNNAGTVADPSAQTATKIIPITISDANPHIRPAEPGTPEGPPIPPIVRPEGEGPDGIPLEAVRMPGPVGITGGLARVRMFGERGGEDEIFDFCSLEEALRAHLGCRFANTRDMDAKFSAVSWSDLTDLGWTRPYLDEEYDYFDRLFLREAGDPGFNVPPQGFPVDFGGMPEEVERLFAESNEENFNDMGPEEIKRIFFAGREDLDRLGRGPDPQTVRRGPGPADGGN